MEPHKPQQATQQKENGAAIASFILGILSLVGMSIITGIPAVVAGAIGMRNPQNKGLAVAGLVMGIISTVVTVLVILFFILVLILGIATFENSDFQFEENTQPTVPFDNQRSV